MYQEHDIVVWWQGHFLAAVGSVIHFLVTIGELRIGQRMWNLSKNYVTDHVQITTTKLAASGLGYLSLVIHDRSYWGSYWWTNQNRHDIIDN